MRCWRGIIGLLAGSFAFGLIGLSVNPLPAAERCQAFVEGLRKREFYDMALDYLEAMRTSPLADKTFLEAIDYETGVTLLAGARLLPPKEREQQLEKARSCFQKFMTEHPQHPMVAAVNNQLANLLVDCGRVKMDQSEQPSRSPDQKKQLKNDARVLFLEAQKTLTQIDAKLHDKHQEYKTVDPNDVKRIAERNQVRTDIMQTRLALASMVYEIAQTYDPGSKENKENLQAAAAKFGEYYKKYSRWVGGFYARIDEARCYKDLGDYDRATKMLDEIMAQSEEDEGLRRMRSSATVLALQIAMLPQLKKYKEAVGIFHNWEKNTARRNDSSPDALAIKCLAGEAALEYARGLKVDNPNNAKSRKEHVQLAKELLKYAARFPGEQRQRARVKLTDSLLGGGEIKVEPPKNYDEARDRARLAWDRLQEPNLKTEEETQLRAEALHNFRFALTHAPADAKIEDLCIIRYCVAYLYWVTEEYYDAAVLGEYLARRYPDRPEAQQGAKIAMAAYAKLYSELAPDEDRKFENNRMTGIAQFITQRWPDSPLAAEAWMMLIRVAVSNRDLVKTVEYLAHVPLDSPRRGETELLTGQTLWGAYLDASRLPEIDRPSQAEMAKIFAQAQTTLQDGVGRSRKAVDAGGEVAYPLVAGVLSLAQTCLETGQADKAITWLDDPKIGPHTLVMAKKPVVDRATFRVETLKATLRAYVAAQRLDKAEETMNALEKAGGDVNLTRIYLSLGRQLEESLKRIRAKGNQEEATKLAQGFTTFLSRLSARPLKEVNFNTLSWVAEMFVSLGASLDPGSGPLGGEAAGYYQKAVDTYRKILDACANDEHFAPRKELIHSIQIRLARCLRRMGKYGQDMDALLAILKVQNNMIDAQIEAARTYQIWGEEKPAFYIHAIRGGREMELPDGSKTYMIWGWGGIAKRVQFSERHQELFHEARYNLALCRYKYAMSQPEQRAELLEQARRDIVIVYKLNPGLGGKVWYEQYDALMKKIQAALGEKKIGLEALDEDASIDKPRLRVAALCFIRWHFKKLLHPFKEIST